MRRQAATIIIATGVVGSFVLAAGIFWDTEVPVRSLLVLTGTLLLVISFWVLRIALRLHPHIRRYSVVRLSPNRLRELARAEQPIEFPLGRSKSATVIVRPAKVTHENAEIVLGRRGEEPTRLPVRTDTTFAGEVAGQTGSEVRLTITEDWISGYIRTESDWWFVEPLRKFRLEADFDEHVVYRTRDLRFKLVYGDDFKPRKVEHHQGGLDPPHRVNPIVPICMVHDEDYSAQALGRPYDQQQALINDINGIYKALGCQFQISVFIWTVNWLTSTNAEQMLDQVEDAVRTVWTDLRQVANRRATNTEVAHATTGKKLDGGVLGMAWHPGVYALSQQQLVLVNVGGLFGGAPNLAFQNMMVAAHEIGHNFDAAHEEADEWCVFEFIWCWDFVRTIMWPEFHDDNVPRFSAGDKNPSHNNAQRVSQNMTTGRNRNF